MHSDQKLRKNVFGKIQKQILDPIIIVSTLAEETCYHKCHQFIIIVSTLGSTHRLDKLATIVTQSKIRVSYLSML